jgi:hypothetical protein
MTLIIVAKPDVYLFFLFVAAVDLVSIFLHWKMQYN